MKVLISAPYMLRPAERPKVEELLKPYGFNVTWAEVGERLEEKHLLEVIGDYDGVICGDDRFTGKVYDAAKKLKVVVKWGTGIDSLHKEEADRRGIRICRTPDAFTQPVADTTLCYILAFARALRDNDQLMKNGKWDKPPGFSMFEKTVGIIGFGNIGQAVARRLRGFGTRILAHDINRVSPALEVEAGVQSADLKTIFSEADFITLHCDLNPTSHHLINAAAFAQMKRKPFLINTSRGPVVDEPALIQALQQGIVAGAGLDVFEEEPLPTSSPLRSMSNVYLASHNSNSSPSCWLRVHRNCVEMLARELGANRG